MTAARARETTEQLGNSWSQPSASSQAKSERKPKGERGSAPAKPGDSALAANQPPSPATGESGKGGHLAGSADPAP